MKNFTLLIIAILIVLPKRSYLQITKYSKKFEEGYYISKDGTLETGWVKVNLGGKGKLKFKPSINAETQVFHPTDVLAFKMGDTEFKSIKNIEVYGALRIKHKFKSGFAEFIDKGKINLLMIYFVDYDPINQNTQVYPNLLLSKPNGNQMVIPLYRRIKRRFDNKIKTQMKQFFEDSQTYWLPKINSISSHEGFFQVIDMVKKYNKI